MNKKRDWVSLLLSITFIATPLLIAVNAYISGNRRLERVQASIRAGMTIEELTTVLGKPQQVVNERERVHFTHGSYKIPSLDENTAVYVYSRDGIPYYTVYVFVDKRRSTVLRSDVENLWW